MSKNSCSKLLSKYIEQNVDIYIKKEKSKETDLMSCCDSNLGKASRVGGSKPHESRVRPANSSREQSFG